MVPLGEGHSCPCPFCQHDIPIPQDYVDWRGQKKDKLRAEEQLINLHKELGRTPKRWEIWLAKIKGGCGCGGCLFFYITMLLGGLLIRLEIWSMGAFSSGASQQANPDGGTTGVLAGLSVLIVLLPYFAATVFIGLGIWYLRRKVFTLATLQGKLVASPPVHEGGLSTCRSCGGPLELKPGHICAPCFYCGSQNLVALDPDWCARLKAGTKQSRESFAEAMAVYHQTTSNAKKRLAAYGVFFVLLGWFLFSGISNAEDKRWPPVGFEKFVEEQRVLTVNPSLQFFLNQPIAFDFHDIYFGVPGELQQNKAVYFLVPLDEGEKLTVTLDEGEVPAVVRFVAENDSERLLKGKRIEWTPLPDRPAVFTADKKSWHCISVAPEQTVKSAPYTIAFEVAGRHRQGKPLDLAGASIGGIVLNMKPKLAPLPTQDSAWSQIGEVEVQLDKNGRVERLRGPVLSAPNAPEANGPGKTWLDSFAPMLSTQVYLSKEPSGYELFWQHVYNTPEAVLKVKEKDGALVGFELSRGEGNDGKTVSGLSKDGSPIILGQRPDGSAATMFNEFTFDREEGFNVYGITPDTPREEAEKLLGKPSREWGRYAHYGAETVCYWDSKVRWIRSPILSQGSRMVKFEGPAQFLKDLVGERFLRIDLSGQPRGLPSFHYRGEFFAFGEDVLVIFTSNSEILSGAVMSGSLFPKWEETQISVVDGLAKMGSFSLKENSGDPDPLFSFFGQEHLHFLFEHSSPDRDLLENFAQESDTSSFQYSIWGPGPIVRIEYWKQHFNKVQET